MFIQTNTRENENKASRYGGISTYLIRIYVDSNKKNKLSQEQTAAEVFVNCCPGALNFTEKPEGENAYGETNQWDNYSELSDPCEDIVIFNSLRENSNKVVKSMT